jgi:hypothetical protein
VVLVLVIVVLLIASGVERGRRKRLAHQLHVENEAAIRLGGGASFDYLKGVILPAPTEGVRLVAQQSAIDGAPADVIEVVRRRFTEELPPGRRIVVDDREIRVEQTTWKAEDLDGALEDAERMARAISLADEPTLGGGNPYRPKPDKQLVERRQREIARYEHNRKMLRLVDATLIGGTLLLFSYLISRLF